MERTLRSVIGVLINDRPNFTNIGRRLASEHPEIFLEMCGARTPSDWKDLVDTAIRIYGIGKITCIKLVKHHTHWGLCEAKDFVDDNYPNVIFKGETNWEELPEYLKR